MPSMLSRCIVTIQLVDHIRSEIGMLEGMLARIPRGRVIQRVGLEARVARLRDELARLPPDERRFDLDEPEEDTRTVSGQLWVLPHGRQFELKAEDRVLKGQLGLGIADASSLPAGAHVVAEIRETRVRAAMPRYTLMAVHQPGEADERR